MMVEMRLPGSGSLVDLRACAVAMDSAMHPCVPCFCSAAHPPPPPGEPAAARLARAARAAATAAAACFFLLRARFFSLR